MILVSVALFTWTTVSEFPLSGSVREEDWDGLSIRDGDVIVGLV